MTLSATPRTVLATTTAHVAAAALRALASRGVDWATEARRAGVPATLEPEFRWRVPVASVVRLFERGTALAGPDFPIEAARRPPDGHTSPLALYCRTRQDGRTALRALVANQDLVTDGWCLAFDEVAGTLRWHARTPAPSVWWFELADVVLSARDLVPGLLPFEVRTDLQAPPGLAGIGCSVGPGAGLALVFPRGMLDRPLRASDPSVRALTERVLEAVRRDRPPAGIRSVLLALGPRATLDEAAASLGVSPRTLHRRLAATGTSFRRELDLARAERAADLLGRVPADEAAELLGYSDARALRRAVQRWRSI